jgi:hypothetical protein
MAKDWEGINFIAVEYKDTGTYIMAGSDEVQVSKNKGTLFNVAAFVQLGYVYLSLKTLAPTSWQLLN